MNSQDSEHKAFVDTLLRVTRAKKGREEEIPAVVCADQSLPPMAKALLEARFREPKASASEIRRATLRGC